jgi:hypothetical protein
MSNKLDGSITKFHGSWQAADSNTTQEYAFAKFYGSWQAEDSKKKPQVFAQAAQDDDRCPWSTRELLTGRPDDWVGGYSPEWVFNYRRQQEHDRKKQINIEGYNSPKKNNVH